MEKYKYIIIDDEFSSHLAVNHHFKNYLNYTYVGAFYNPKKALNFIQENEIDLIFLDIEMPEMNGFQFLEALNKNIFVVILTAFPEKYSLNAHSFIDKNLVFFSNKAQLLYYVPKIIARFEKLYAEKEIINRINQLSKNETHIFPKMVDNKTIPLTDICSVVVVGHNIVLKIKNGEEHVFRMTFRELKNFLPVNLFFQIRRNVIINIIYVTAFNDTTICLGEEHFVISLKINKNIISDLQTALQVLKQ